MMEFSVNVYCVALRVNTHQENLAQCLQKMMKMISLLMERQVEMKPKKGEFDSLNILLLNS